MPDLPMLLACGVALFGSGLFAFRHYSDRRHDDLYHQQEVFFLLAFVVGLTVLSFLAQTSVAAW